MENSKVEDYLRHAKIDLMTKSVFLSTICLRLKHSFSNDIPTAGTDGLSIIYNPEFFSELSAVERTGLLAHEVWHVAFSHFSRLGNRDKQQWNIAGDYVINYMLTQNGYTIPKGGLLDAQYKGMSTEEVYEIVKQDQKDNPQDIDFQMDLLEAPSAKQQKEVNDKVTDIIIQAQIQSKASGKDHGEIPDEIVRAIDELINPKLPWNQLLVRFLSNMVKDDYTWTRPNKRFFPHHYLPSQYSPTIGDIVVAIDTSGSVSQEDLVEMLSEIEDIRTTFKPESLTIIDCDSSIHNVFKIEKYDNILELKFQGCGGTDFQPVIDYCNEQQPEVLIYFTDLQAEDITEEPGYPILWICNSKHNPSSVGETIYIK